MEGLPKTLAPAVEQLQGLLSEAPELASIWHSNNASIQTLYEGADGRPIVRDVYIDGHGFLHDQSAFLDLEQQTCEILNRPPANYRGSSYPNAQTGSDSQFEKYAKMHNELLARKAEKLAASEAEASEAT